MATDLPQALYTHLGRGVRVEDLVYHLDLGVVVAGACPGRKPPVLAVKRPARPYRIAIQNQFTVENAKGAEGLRVFSRISRFFYRGFTVEDFAKRDPVPEKRPPQRFLGSLELKFGHSNRLEQF